LISAQKAQNDYGVVVDPNTLAVDAVRTSELRARRSARASGEAKE
jgi:hypothetical protein